MLRIHVDGPIENRGEPIQLEEITGPENLEVPSP
jgi:hypothetical protein